MPFDSYDNEASQAIRLMSKRRVPAIVWALLVFVLGLLATGWVSLNERAREQDAAKEAFKHEVVLITSAVKDQLLACESLIRTFQSIFLASDEVTEDEYVRAYENMYANSIVRISLQALAYAERKSSSAGDRYITTLFAPREGNQAIVGLDIQNQPPNLDAVLRSRDTDQIAMSSVFRLRQSGNSQVTKDGFILRLPVYAHGVVPESVELRRKHIIGSVGASFRVEDLINSALPSKIHSLASLSIADVTGGAPVTLYQHRFGQAASTQAEVAELLQFGGRQWQITGVPQISVVNTQNWLRVLITGVVISLLLAALVWSLAMTRARAFALGRAMSEKYRASEERFRKLNELLPSLVLLARKDNGTVVYRNAVARQRLTVDTGLAGLTTVLPHDIAHRLEEISQSEHPAFEVYLHDSDGKPFWLMIRISSIVIDDVPMWLLVGNDVSEQRQLSERLSYQTNHDALTRLYNRTKFEAHTQTLLESEEARASALLFIDLDQFKLINDISGHDAGDALLVQIAKRIRDELRPSDLLGRMGGDEFGVLLTSVPSAVAALQTAERLRRSIEEFVFNWERRIYTVSASIGVVMVEESTSVKELFANADAACFLAKENGRNRVQLHSSSDTAIASRMVEMEWVNRIRDAMRYDRLLLDYQELHPLKETNRGAHIELLLRLRDEDGQEVLPGVFLPAAERYGLMPHIDRWVLETALAHFDQLHPQGAALGTCAINLSGASLEDEGLFDFIKNLIERHQINPQRLLFEITETVAMRDINVSSALISRLRLLGCRVALDDFGSGMSSFGYLKTFELDVLKIDGSFVQTMTTDATSRAIVNAATEIAHLQGLEVVAEWVSTPDILLLISSLQVDYAQGFALHKPERVPFQRTNHA